MKSVVFFLLLALSLQAAVPCDARPHTVLDLRVQCYVFDLRTIYQQAKIDWPLPIDYTPSLVLTIWSGNDATRAFVITAKYRDAEQAGELVIPLIRVREPAGHFSASTAIPLPSNRIIASIDIEELHKLVTTTVEVR